MNASIQRHDFERYAARAESKAASLCESFMICGACGAQIAVNKFTASIACPMCASTRVALEKRAVGVSPDGLIPFEIDKPQALSRLSNWAKRRWFAPNRLKEVCRKEKLEGVYLPFWVFDAEARGRYDGRGGFERKRRDKRGKPHTVVDWTPVSDSVTARYEDIPICAADKRVQEVIERILPYGVKGKAIPYSNEYLRGFSAQRYAADARESFESARERIRDDLNRHARQGVLRKGYNRADVRNVEVSLSNVHYRQLLLPAWLCALTVGERRYLYAVNGESGKVGGPRAWSVPKLVLVAAAAALLIAFFITATWENATPSHIPISAKVKTTPNISGR